MGYCRLLSTGILISLGGYYEEEKYVHCVMILLIVYSLLYLWKGEFKYQIMERVVFFLGDGAFLTLFYIFKYHPEYITQYDLDFFGLAGIMILDILLYLVRGGKLMCYGKSEGQAEVNPEPAEEGNESPKFEKKVNRYEHDSG